MDKENSRLLTLPEIEERMLLVTGNITDMAEGYFSKAASQFARDMACIQDERARKQVMEEIENRAIILSDKDGAGILMLALDDWTAFKKEVICKVV